MVLEEVCLQVDLVKTALEPEQKARSYRYTIILMDTQKPVPARLDATREIRPSDGFK